MRRTYEARMTHFPNEIIDLLSSVYFVKGLPEVMSHLWLGNCCQIVCTACSLWSKVCH